MGLFSSPHMQDLLIQQGIVRLGCVNMDGISHAPEREAAFTAQVEAGRYDCLPFMKGYAGKRCHADGVLGWCRTVVVAVMPVKQDAPEEVMVPDRPARGRVARYAWGRDYHRVMDKALGRVAHALDAAIPGERWKVWVDAHPWDEVFLAQEAGLGFRGRHGLLMVPGLGAWCALGIIASSAVLEPGLAWVAGGGEEPAPAPGSCPVGCRACVRACPTGALSVDGSGLGTVEPCRCVSFLTIESRSGIPEHLRPGLGDRIFGCDACLEACPLGKKGAATTVREFLEHRAGPWLDLAKVLALKDHEDCIRMFAGTPLMRPGRDGLVCSACVIAGNQKSAALRDSLEGLGGDPSALVREHAAWALARLNEQ